MNRRAGYSLFEVLIAFVIMSLVLAALIPGQASLLGRATVQEEQLLAYDYALSRIALTEIGDLPQGTQHDLYRDWQITTEVTENGAVADNIVTLTITVSVHDLQGKQLAHAQTLKVAQ